MQTAEIQIRRKPPVGIATVVVDDDPTTALSGGGRRPHRRFTITRSGGVGKAMRTDYSIDSDV